jgi:hypothetical protein
MTGHLQHQLSERSIALFNGALLSPPVWIPLVRPDAPCARVRGAELGTAHELPVLAAELLVPGPEVPVFASPTGPANPSTTAEPKRWTVLGIGYPNSALRLVHH